MSYENGDGIMAVNKVSITINSRMYTVVAQESEEYITKLGEHVNEKVNRVIKSGQNIMGERPVVLAALNICDEYYKALEKADIMLERMGKIEEKNAKLQNENKKLKAELEDVNTSQVSIDETALKAEVTAAKNDLDEANNKIKFLENHIKSLEQKLREEKDKYEKREKEVLEMIEKG